MNSNNPVFSFVDPRITQFFSSAAYGVLGASTNRDKFGNKVLRCYLQHHKKVYPVNPRAESIEGVRCLSQIADLPAEVKSISVVTPPKITEKIVEEAAAKGIQNIWLQPGAESDLAIQIAQEHLINLIADGTCILQVLGFKVDG